MVTHFVAGIASPDADMVNTESYVPMAIIDRRVPSDNMEKVMSLYGT